jgi:23S rRNA (adenine2503-C2)-methyltransferase
MSKFHLLEQAPDGLQAWFAARGLPAYRTVQVRRWVFRKRAADFDQMTDLPGLLRSQLADHWTIFTTRIAKHLKADDGTEKLLLELADHQRIECVLLRDQRSHRTICISTQVGCAMGCAFCASGLGGMVRNLTAGEIVEQMLRLQRLLAPSERLSHIVVMGMGEPLANLDHLLPALAAATGAGGLGVSARRVTISTVGLPAGIRRLAEEGSPYHLAVSLHAADQRLRSQLVPAGRKHSIAAILAAADDYFERTGRRVTFECVLLAGVNDRPEDARRLARLLGGRPVLVNVIPYNRVPGLPYRAPAPVVTARFVESLRQGNLNVKIRHRKGQGIDAACGQLRRGGDPPMAPVGNVFAPAEKPPLRGGVP